MPRETEILEAYAVRELKEIDQHERFSVSEDDLLRLQNTNEPVELTIQGNLTEVHVGDVLQITSSHDPQRYVSAKVMAIRGTAVSLIALP